MNALHAPETRPTPLPPPVSEDQELTLAELLDLFAPADPTVATARRPLRSHAVRIGRWVQESSRRAAEWGAVPQLPALRGHRSVAMGTGEAE